ncbi:PAS domain S-box/PAS domain S-box/PAS domain S-box [Idiomarina sp. A28L]|uniref:PAS domain S-box protein n=1 Tax=Idiomarina sp. A28L TaxID=1036674 RepID=UPI00021388E6|nr:PAS domain S-box protein [Idiomarina sp. A28L]EGN76185.1 PAS domain S-box/PAS domain S-box/PAS domain S-box [Idiomarina sp. A28L]
MNPKNSSVNKILNESAKLNKLAPVSKAVFARLTRIAQDTLNVPIAFISLVQEGREYIQYYSGPDIPQFLSSFDSFSRTILENNILEVNDTESDVRLTDYPAIKNHSYIRSYSAIPLIGQNQRRLGFFWVLNKSPRVLLANERELLDFLAESISSEVQTSLSLEVQSNEQRLLSILEGTNIGTWEWNVQTGDTVFNERWAEIVGYTLSELEPISIDTWMSLAHPDDLEHSGELLNKHFSGELEFYDCKARMRHKNGSWIWVHDRGRVVSRTDDGEPLIVSGTHADITLQMQAKQELESQRLFLENIFNSDVSAFIVINEDGRFTYANNEAIRVLGLQLNDSPKDNEATFDDPRWHITNIDGSEFPNDKLPFAVVSRTKQPVKDIKHAIRWPDGEWKALSVNGAPLLNAFGETEYVFAVRDITQQVLLEEALRESEAQFRSLVDNMPGVTYRCRYDEEWTMLYLSDKVDPLSGYPASDFIQNKVRSYDSVIHPDDKKMASIAVEKAIEEHTDWLIEYRVLHRDGSVQWAKEKGRPVYDKNGDVEHLDGFILNVTDDKSNRIELENQLSAFKALNDISSIAGTETLERLNLALALGSSYLGLELGIVSQIQESEYKVVAFTAPENAELKNGQTFALSNTYCDITLNANDVITIDEMKSSEYRGHPCYQSFTLESYIGVPLYVEGKRFGTLSFSSTTSRENSFRETEKQFIRLMARWVSTTLELKNQQATLERSEQRLRGLFELSPIGIALNDYETGAFVDLNAALLLSTGYTRDEFISLSYWDVTPREYEAEEFKQLKMLDTTSRYGPFEKEYIRKDGSRYPVCLHGMLVEDNSGRKLIWSIIEDISERKRNDEIKNQFVSTVSHELRTPISSITGSLQLLLGGATGELPKSAVEMIAIALKNSSRLSLLIDDILDLEKLLAGRIEWSIETLSVHSLFKDIIERNEPFAKRHNVTLSVEDIDPALEIDVDAQRFEQVITNLLSNAVKFSSSGDIVTLNAKKEELGVRISIIDRGEGIPEEFHPRVFEKFAQANASNTRKTGGTGLGLSICKEIVEQLGGTIDFESNPGGTVFNITFPYRNKTLGENNG